MFNFGNRNMNFQGGSMMIALPMVWIKGVEEEFTSVNIKMDEQNNLIICPVINK